MAFLEHSCYRFGDEPIRCPKCSRNTVKNGKILGKQQYKCKECNKRFQLEYTYKACEPRTSPNIVALIKEGCGIRSIARLLSISASTVLGRIRKIAAKIEQPAILKGKEFEVDELRTYIKKKDKPIWIVLALERSTKKIVTFNICSRTNKTLNTVIKTIELAKPKKIFTDKLKNYRYLINNKIHSTKQYGTNYVERANLDLRTNLKRLNRKTNCFSKSLTVLTAILKIYFWC
jgi:IS1 family transposase/transposase-like protein